MRALPPFAAALMVVPPFAFPWTFDANAGSDEARAGTYEKDAHTILYALALHCIRLRWSETAAMQADGWILEGTVFCAAP
jgi:hypothetical protein